MGAARVAAVAGAPGAARAGGARRLTAIGVARSYVSSNIVKGNPFGNVGGYSNAEVDKLFAEARLRRGAYGQRYDNGLRDDGTAGNMRVSSTAAADSGWASTTGRPSSPVVDTAGSIGT